MPKQQFPIEPQAVSTWFIELLSNDSGFFKDLSSKLEKNQSIQAIDKAALVRDYAAIGSFLADSETFLRMLEPLEDELRSEVKRFAASSEGMWKLKKNIESSSDPVFKTHKLLSHALSRLEIQFGFNNPNFTLGSLHTQALEYDASTKAWQKRYTTETNKTTGKPENVPVKDLSLPTGAPTIVGDLDGRSFNNILLRHGFQFKDVAAGPEHGEYAHRLQWHAIMRAVSGNHHGMKLELRNTPLQIFKSLGSIVCGAQNVNGTTSHLYVWELLFDCAVSAGRAKGLNTAAWSKNTFNSPETLTTSLCNRSGPQAERLKYLRTLVDIRRNKRWQEGPTKSDRDYALKPASKDRVGKVARMYSGFPMADLEDKYKGKEEELKKLLSADNDFGRVGLLTWFLR